MDIKYAEDGSVNISKKAKALIVVVGLLILACIVYYVTMGRTPEIPGGKLSSEQGATKFERDETLFPFMYQFADIPYIVGTPSKGITRVEGGYAYTYNGMGLVAAELSNARTMLAYSQDLYSSLYAIQDQPQVTELLSESGFINGYSAEYGVYEVKIPALNKTIHEFMYLLRADRESIALVATTESKKSEDYTVSRDFLIKMINTVTYYKSDTETTEEDDYDIEEETKSSSSDNMYSSDSFERQAVLTAAQDYNKMCLIFSYMNVTTSPKECYVLDKNGKKINAAFVNPGEYGFVIPDVKEGDDITVCINSKSLDGATLTQQEYDDYKREQESYKEGNLHVEEGYEDTEDYVNVDVVSDEELEEIKKSLEGSGIEDKVLTTVTKFSEQ